MELPHLVALFPLQLARSLMAGVYSLSIDSWYTKYEV